MGINPPSNTYILFWGVEMNIAETLQLAATMIAPAFFDLMGLAAFGAVAIAAISEIIGRGKGKIFHDKYAEQTSKMSLWLIIISLVACVAGVFIAASRMPWLPQWLTDTASPVMPVYIATGAGLILFLPYTLSWKKLRQTKSVHIALGLGSAAAMLSAIVLSVGAFYVFAASTTPGAETMTVTALPLDAHSIFWPLAAQYLLFAIGSGGGLSLAYLVLRREKDDFGRDYYKFSLPCAARWAIVGSLGAILTQGWLFGVMPESARVMALETGMSLAWLVSIALTLLCCILWLLLSKSESPMRMKWIAFAGAILLWAAHSFNVVFCMGLGTLL